MIQPSGRKVLFVLAAFCCASGGVSDLLAEVPSQQVDVLVFDSTPAGITTAVAAARAGRKVLLVTEDKHLGGLITSGLGNTNAGQRDTVGGLTREFHERILAHYVAQYGKDSQQVQDCSDGFYFEPHVAEKILADWLAEAGVTCLMETRVVAVEKDGTRLVAVKLADDRRIEARVFVDASYEGDLLKLAGCKYRVGREGRDEYHEALAGVRYPPDQVGQADGKTQAYDYRLCLTDDPKNQVPFRKPARYDAKNYAWHAAKFRQTPPTRLKDMLPLNRMPNRKTDSRTGEWIGGSWKYPEADDAERQRIAAAHHDYSAGYVWFLLTDESVPPALREELRTWGYAADEFTDNGNWPHHLYVREARRLVGDYVMTERDVTRERFKPDSVALGSYYLDVHAVQLVPASDAVGGFVAEGGVGKARIKPYEIPYRALLPRREETSNLLVPVCLSASHVAYSTIRMEPVYMMLGQACGVAAAMSVEEERHLHDLSVEKLQTRLREQKQVLDAKPFTLEWPAVRDATPKDAVR